MPRFIIRMLIGMAICSVLISFVNGVTEKKDKLVASTEIKTQAEDKRIEEKPGLSEFQVKMQKEEALRKIAEKKSNPESVTPPNRVVFQNILGLNRHQHQHPLSIVMFIRITLKHFLNMYQSMYQHRHLLLIM